MAVAVTTLTGPNGSPQFAIGDMWTAFGSVAFSGSYATGGDSWDASTLFTGPASSLGTIFLVDVSGGAGYQMEYDKTNKKIKVYSAAGTELAAGAYPAALTGDANVVVQVFAK